MISHKEDFDFSPRNDLKFCLQAAASALRRRGLRADELWAVARYMQLIIIWNLNIILSGHQNQNAPNLEREFTGMGGSPTAERDALFSPLSWSEGDLRSDDKIRGYYF